MGDVDFAGRRWRGVFEPLGDPAYFARVEVDPEAGTITWPAGPDMAPEPCMRRRAAIPRTAHGPRAETAAVRGGGSALHPVRLHA